VQWGPLRANLLGCALLVLLRAAERLGLAPHHSLAAAKLRTSGCGTLSTSNLVRVRVKVRARARAAHLGLRHPLHLQPEPEP